MWADWRYNAPTFTHAHVSAPFTTCFQENLALAAVCTSQLWVQEWLSRIQCYRQLQHYRKKVHSDISDGRQ